MKWNQPGKSMAQKKNIKPSKFSSLGRYEQKLIPTYNSEWRTKAFLSIIQAQVIVICFMFNKTIDYKNTKQLKLKSIN